MRAILQRVSKASVTVQNEIVGQIGAGLLVLLGVHRDDTATDVAWMAEKIPNMRIFDDDSGKMNHAVTDIGGSILLVSQFTLYGDCKKGRRPNFMAAMAPEPANQMIESLIAKLREANIPVQTGRFGAMMAVELLN